MKKNVLLSGIFILTLLAFFSCSHDASELSLSGTISGKVYYSNCDSTEGIVVSLANENSIIAYTQCADDGSFSFLDLPFDEYTVYASSSFSTEKIINKTVRIDNNTTVYLDDLKLTATGTLSGTVILDETATGNAGFSVYVAGTSYIAKSADDGTFTISGIPAGSDYEIYIEKGSFTSFWKKSNVKPFADTSLNNISITTQEIKDGSLINNGDNDDKDDGEPSASGTNLRYYSIDYELNGGTLSDDSPIYHIYGLNTILGKPEKAGFSFVGWYTTPDFKGKPISKLSAKSIESDIKLYALWTSGIAVSVTELSGKLLNCNTSQSVLILDESPDFDIIHTALTKNPQVKVEMDFSMCDITNIPENAFKDITNLTAVTLPETVNKIGSNAFNNCSNLTSINIPSAVTAIENYTFCGCKKLQNLTLPDNITTIGSYAFQNCSALTNLTIPESTKSIGTYAFSGAGITSLEIPESVSYIPANLFDSCTALKTVILPNSITSIAEEAFYHCSSLSSINMPTQITRINNNTFNGCSALQSITLSENTSYIGCFAFCNSGIKEISIPDSVETIDQGAFSGCKSLTKIKMPENLKNCASFAFLSCEALQEVIIPNLSKWVNITFRYNNYSSSSYDYASTNPLRYAKKLIIDGKEVTNFVIPEGITRINNYAFTNCENITSITIPTSLEVIEPNAFYDSNNIKNIYISDLKAWCNCYGTITYKSGQERNIYLNNTLLTELDFSNYSSITTIDDSTFASCSSLKKVIISGQIKTIGTYAFDNCKNLSTVILKDGIKTISTHAFSECSSLTSISIPSSVQQIGRYAFWYSKNISTITIPDPREWYYTSKESAYTSQITSSGSLVYKSGLYKIESTSDFTKQLTGTYEYPTTNNVKLIEMYLFKAK